MTLLHWSLKYMFYNHDLLPQLDFLNRQTATQTSWTPCEVPGWQVTPYQVLQALLPARLCLWRTLSSRCSAMLACCSHQDFPAEPPHQKLVGPVSLSPFGNPSLNVTRVYMVWGNEWPWLGWGIFLTRALTLGSTGTAGNLEEKNHLSYSFYSSSSQIKST